MLSYKPCTHPLGGWWMLSILHFIQLIFIEESSRKNIWILIDKRKNALYEWMMYLCIYVEGLAIHYGCKLSWSSQIWKLLFNGIFSCHLDYWHGGKIAPSSNYYYYFSKIEFFFSIFFLQKQYFYFYFYFFSKWWEQLVPNMENNPEIDLLWLHFSSNDLINILKWYYFI